MYTGKNDFFATRDVPSAGCAYGLMGSGSLSISLVAPPSPPPPPSPPSPAFNCSLFGCTCQGFANYYGAIKGVGWGCAPQPAGRMWWSGHDCNAATQHGQFCDGPACTLPGHAPCDPPAPSPGVGGSWSASQDLQNAKVHVATTQGGTNLTTTTFIATGSNVMLTTLLLNHTATVAFELRFPTGDEVIDMSTTLCACVRARACACACACACALYVRCRLIFHGCFDFTMTFACHSSCM